MRNYIKKILNGYENDFGEERALNDLATEELKSGDEFHPGRPIIMHAGYGLDGDTKRRDLYHSNYENHLSREEKGEINREIVGLAELSSLLHDPEAILEEEENISENRSLAKEVLEHLADVYDGKNPKEEIVHQMLIEPLSEKLLDRVFDRGSILYGVLHPTMVRNTEHSKEEYGHLLNHILLQGMMHPSRKDNWQKGLAKLFKEIRGEV